MTFTIITWLLGAIFLVSWIQPTKQRLIAALLTSAPTCWHHLGYFDVYGFAYYGSAAVIDAGIIAALSLVRPIPKMAIRLQTLCTISIGLNVVGWVLWRTGLEPTVYNWAYVVFYASMLLTMIRRGHSNNVGINPTDSGRTGFGVPFSARSLLDFKHGGAI